MGISYAFGVFVEMELIEIITILVSLKIKSMDIYIKKQLQFFSASWPKASIFVCKNTFSTAWQCSVLINDPAPVFTSGKNHCLIAYSDQG